MCLSICNKKTRGWKFYNSEDLVMEKLMEIGNPNIPSLENLPSFENNNVPLLIATIVVIGLAIYQQQKSTQYKKQHS